MTGILFASTVLIFLVAMSAYVMTLVRLQKPVSFFVLSTLSKQGNRNAGVAHKAWVLAIFMAVATGANMLLEAFNVNLAGVTRPFVIALFLVVIAASAIRHQRDKAHVANLRERANRDFNECTITSIDPRYSFSGKFANVLRREETGGVRGILDRTADFGVTIYAANTHGERFLYKWFSTSPKPFIKHFP